MKNRNRGGVKQESLGFCSVWKIFAGRLVALTEIPSFLRCKFPGSHNEVWIRFWATWISSDLAPWFLIAKKR